MPRLIITQPEQETEQAVDLAQEIRIGRGPGNELLLEGPNVSRNHASIAQMEGQYYLTDLGSGNGTWLNGSPVTPNEKNLLRHNDLIRIDPYHLRFLAGPHPAESVVEEEENTDADVLEIKLLKKVLDAIDTETVPSLEVLNGVAEGKRVFLTGETEEITIGRDPNCEFPVNEHVISRNHAKVIKQWGGVLIRDLDSKNGTYVNNRRVVEEPLHDGDRIALGTIVFLYRNPQEVNIRELGQELAQKKKKKAALRGAAPPPPPEEKEQIPEEVSAEEVLPAAPAAAYPVPQPVKRLTAVEIGLIGLGVVVLSFALITLINLLLS